MKDIFVGIWMLFCVACHGTPVKTVTVLFLGDSLTEGYGVARGEKLPFPTREEIERGKNLN